MPALDKAGIRVVASSDYPPTVKDMTAQLAPVKAAKPDAVLSLSYPSDSVLYMQYARTLGIEAPFQLVLIGPSIPFFGKMFGPAADGIVSLGQWTPHQKKWARAAPFYDAYKKRFNDEPDYLDTAIAYLSCEIVEQAVAKAGLERERLRQAYATGTFETIAGRISFKGVQNDSPTVIAQIQGGQTHIVWPTDLATSQYKPKGPWPKN
jgi:branched-chain amino acid transport system substrate-binding protein